MSSHGRRVFSSMKDDSKAFQELINRTQEFGPNQVDAKDILRDPNLVIESIERYGTYKLGEFEVDDKLGVCAFEGKSMLTMGRNDLHPADWKESWCNELDRQWYAASHQKRLRASNFNQKVKVGAYVVGIEHAAGAPGIGLLQPVLVRWQLGAAPLSVFGLPAVQSILSYKWKTWARRYLIIEFILYLLWLLCTVVFAVSFTSENLDDSLSQVWHSGSEGTTRIISCVLSVCFMFPFLVIELNTIWSYGRSWLHQFWNMIDAAMYTLQILILAVYCNRSSVKEEWYSVVLASQCVLLFAKIQYFSRVFDTSRGSLVDTLKVVIGEVKWFLLFIFLTMLSFGIAFSILYRDEEVVIEGEVDNTFASVQKSIVSMFSFVLGGFHFDVFYKSQNKAAAIIFFLIYQSIMAIMLLNLLIAIMTDSYAKVMDDEKLWNLCSKAQIIDELETTLPRFLTSQWDAPYVHVLKLIPRETVNLNSVWNRIDMAGEQSAKTMTELTGMAETFRWTIVQKVHEVRRKLDARLGAQTSSN
eukprot:g4775.t1